MNASRYLVIGLIFSVITFLGSSKTQALVDKTARSESDFVGFIDDDGRHNTKHNHSLKFTDKYSGDIFKIVDSPEITKVHCNKSKRLLVKIKGVKSPRFLLWGNNLTIKTFKVLEELAIIPHKKYKKFTAKVSLRDQL